MTRPHPAQPGAGRPRPPVPLVREARVRGFRSARDVHLTLGGVCALVGEARAGKSTLLAAIHAALDPSAAPVTAGDVARGGDEGVDVRLWTVSGPVTLGGVPPATRWSAAHEPPAALLLPTAARGSSLVAAPGRTSEAVERALGIARAGTAPGAVDGSDSAVARSLPGVLEAWCEAGVRATVVLVEEPELFLPPQAQRYAHRLLRRLAAQGNQVVYSTHAPAFLQVRHLDELRFVRRDRGGGTRVDHPAPLPALEDWSARNEFEGDRAELFLARAVLLVEGWTERLVLPYVFGALGLDADREGVSIIECGGKAGMPMIGAVCRAAGVPFVALHDRDAPAGRRPSPTHRAINAAIAREAGAGRTIELVPDFEGAARLPRHDHKPLQALRHFTATAPAGIPAPLERAVRLSVDLARRERP